MSEQSYIADFHLNIHPNQLDELNKWILHCERFCDFFTLAYYPYEIEEYPNGFRTEKEIGKKELEEQWQYVLQTIEKYQQEDNFICFPGFEWQGTGEDGDHNVYFKESGQIELPPRYSDLVSIYENQDVIGIPHHLAYSLGNRGKNWSTHNESFSPFVETFSHHGSSECDDTPIPMVCHRFMGPRVDNTSVMSGLKRGYHFGIIAAGDNHSVPAEVQNGRMGVWASKYSKDSIWKALTNRHTYGFTKSRIDLRYSVDSALMGSQVTSKENKAEISLDVLGNSYLQRLELYKNGELEDMHFYRHKTPANDKTFTFKFFVELGWGPNPALFPDISSRLWQAQLSTTGVIKGVEPVYSSFENEFNIIDEHTVSLTAKSQNIASSFWMREGNHKTEGFIFEIEGSLGNKVVFELPDNQFVWNVAQILDGSFVEVLEQEAKRLIFDRAGIEKYYRSDAWYHNAYKIKVHKGHCLENYSLKDSFLVPVEDQETSWFIKAIQADGQTAWGSPIWLSH